MNNKELNEFINTLNIILRKEYIQLDFGKNTNKSGENKKDDIHLESSVKINPHMLKPIILYLFKAGVEYEKKTKISIGFEELED